MVASQQDQNTKSLILGGARSGKSSYAEKLAHDSGKEVIYVATAKVLDDEIKQRVERHQSDRPVEWKTIEEPIALADTLLEWTSPKHILLVDCLTMWITNLLTVDSGQKGQKRGMCASTLLSNHALYTLEKERDKLLNCLSDLDSVVFVSNEVGMGIIPMGELTRQYVDETGRLHQALAQKVDNVTLMVAGLPHTIKDHRTKNQEIN